MVPNSTVLLYDLMVKYVFPILKFANIYVDDNGILRPMNSDDPELAYTDEDRILCFASTNAMYVQLKSKKDEFEIFNPLTVARHCVFLANMVMATCNKMNDVSTDNLVYDEDLDEWLVKDTNKPAKLPGKIEMFHMRDNSENTFTNKIVFSKTDGSGNPIGEPEAKYMNPDILLATLGAVINLIKKYAGIIAPQFAITDTAIISISIGLQKFKRERLREKKDRPPEMEIVDSEEEEMMSDDILEMDEIEYAVDLDKTDDLVYYFPEDKMNQYDPDYEFAKVNSTMMFPTFKTVESTSEDRVKNAVLDSEEFEEFADIEFE